MTKINYIQNIKGDQKKEFFNVLRTKWFVVISNNRYVEIKKFYKLPEGKTWLK